MIELPIIDAREADAETPKQRFWRSLPHLQQDSEFQAIARHEFMPGATEAPGGASRRQFLQLMGASMALAGLSACRRPVQPILPYARKPEEVIPGIPLFYATAMPFRGVVQSLLVESHEGRPTKVEGNPEHPMGGGATGLFEQASILALYDPDRSRHVLRDGSEASWADFVNFCRQFVRDAAAKRVVVLSEETSSPTMAAVRRQLAQQYPQLRWVTYRAEGDDVVGLGMQQAFGSPYRPIYRFSEAEVIVSLDADFLGATAPDFVHATREFADSRRLSSPDDTMSRLYVAESAYSVTGSMADHRLRLRSSEIPAFAAALASQLGVAGAGNAGASFADHPYVAAIAEDLQAAGSRGVVLAGETQPPAIHALCAAINSALGSIGTTVDLLDTAEPPVQAQSAALTQLVQDMNAGNVDALVCLGVNPVYDAPANLDFASAMRQVNETIHLGLWNDETAQIARWHLPRAHYLEAWGDGRAYDGTLSVIQPLIAPLYDDARSEIEVLNALANGLDQSGYDLVRAQWRSVLPEPFEQGWRRVLHDGFLPETAYVPVTPTAQPVNLAGLSAISGDALEVVFRLDPTLFDGTFANNAWCQELPDPTTKIVWDNVAVISPQTAEQLGLSKEYNKGRYYVDVIELTVDGRSIELPIWTVPGHADHSISVTLGYGRNIASKRSQREGPVWDKDKATDVYGQGPLANGVGTNVSVLRTTTASTVATDAQVRRTGETYRIITTQDHGTLDVEARPLFRMGTYGEYQQDPRFAEGMEEPTPKEAFEDYPTLWEEQHPAEQDSQRDNPYYRNQWGMVIDLNACTGCNACVVACTSENNIQVVGKDEVGNGRELSWMRLDRYFVSHTDDEEELPENPQMVLQPVLCQHCENAPCEAVCPVAATVHSPDGTNQMIYNRCIGTRYCANNCPYKVRRFNYYNWTKTIPLEVQMAQNPNVTMRFRGVMEKCSFCIQRIRKTQQRAGIEQRAIQDGEVLTACQQVCPAQAIVFGDLNDPNSRVAGQMQNPRGYAMLAELNVKPRVSYLARVRNPNPRLEQAEA
ncbi:MAG: TAT-variant-translocated molybdopterin oxidoreductase [Rhodothermales bacterium]